MADFAARVLKLVSEPDYKPITLKAMSRRFQVDADDYAEFRATVRGLVKAGKLDLGKDKTLRRPEQFLRAARAGKPFVVCKTGRSGAGRRAVASHSGALAGEGRLYDAFLRSDAFKSAVAWGKAEILRSRPKHRVYDDAPGDASGAPGRP